MVKVKDFLSGLIPHSFFQFQTEFSRQVLETERRRAVLISILLLFIMFVITLNRFVFSDYITVYKEFRNYYPLAIFTVSSFLLYEIGVYFAFGLLIKKKLQPPTFVRYANATLETSLPSIIIIYIAFISNPSTAMYSPPTYGYFIFILISTLRLDFKLSFYTGFISALEYTIIVFYYHGNGTLIDSPEYSLQNILVKSVFYILGGIFAGLVSTQIKESVLKSVSLLQEKNEITQLFGRHVSPSVVNKLLETNMQLDSETRFVCVMFLDIRNFTKFSESRTPAEVVDYLNLLFSFMIEIVNRNNGIINKFLGDGFMAVYGAPIGDGKECENAIKTVQEILEEVKVFNLQFRI